MSVQGLLSRELRLIAVPVLVVVALLGYLLGHGSGSPSAPIATSGSAERSQLISANGVLLEAPPGWRRAAQAPAIPGLSVESPTALVAGGAGEAGLVSGQLAGGVASPLPASLLAELRGLPRVQVLNLVSAQAYAYTGLAVRGYARALDVYVLPSSTSAPTVVACYAPAPGLRLLSECAQIVSRLTLVGQSQYELTPDGGYGGQLGGLLRGLDAQRLALRRQMRASATPAAVGAIATQLAAKLDAASAALGALEAPLAASAAQTALAVALARARDAYRALGRAAEAEALAAYDRARVDVERADAGIDSALETYALLGYSH